MTATRRARTAAILLAATLLGAACGGDDGATPTAETDPTTTTTSAPTPPGYEEVVRALAADEMQGRDNNSPGSSLAQDYLVEQLRDFAKPLTNRSSGSLTFRHDFVAGTNIMAVIPGGDRADEYVILGAHYDHLGTSCRTGTPGDTVCNGATDNAAGVATVLAVGRALAADDQPPSRSVILAFWDGEEDGLLGSTAYLGHPDVPLDHTVAYLNWDIQGADLLPSLADVTVMVGAETGGPNLVAAARSAAKASGLETLGLSLLFGQGRSDHAPFAAAGVPTVFFTDSNPPCYHTAQDDVTAVDFDKLGRQIKTAEALTRDLATTDALPTFVGDAPAATYDDAVSMLEVVSRAQPDFARFPEHQATAEQFLRDLGAIVDAGPAAFDDRAVGILLAGSADLVAAIASGACAGAR